MFERYSSYLYFVLILFQAVILSCFGFWFYGYFVKSSYNEFLQEIKLCKNKIFIELKSRYEEVENLAKRLSEENFLKVGLLLNLKVPLMEFIKRESIPDKGIHIFIASEEGMFLSTYYKKDVKFLMKETRSKHPKILFVKNKGVFFLIKYPVVMRDKFLGYVYALTDLGQDKRLLNTIEKISPYASIVWFDRKTQFAWDVIKKEKVKVSNLITLSNFQLTIKNLFKPKRLILSISPNRFTNIYLLYSTEKFVEKVTSITRLIFLSFVVVILLTLFISYLLAKRITSPINFLRKMCTLLSENPHAGQIEVKRLKHHEFKDLAESFNKVLLSFLDAQKKLQQWAEDRIQRTEIRYRTLVDVCPIGVLTLDNDKNITFFNDSVVEILEYTPDELNEKNFLSLFPHQSANKVKSFIENAKLKTCLPVEIQMLTKKDNIKWIELYASWIGDKDNILILLVDITGRKEMEEEKRILINVVEQVPEAIIVTDKSGYIQYVNSAFEKLFGYRSYEVRYQNFQFVWKDRELGKRIWRFVIEGNTWAGRSKDVKKNGGEIDTFTTIAPLKDPEGKIKNMIIVKRDITQELKLEKEVSRVQRLQAIGTLAGGIAHDFNNILTTIMGYIQLAISMVSYKDKVYNYLEKCLDGCFRAKDLIGQLLTFSRSEEEKKEPILISSIIKEAVKFFKASLPPNISIELIIKDPSLKVVGNATQLYQILVNLITNSAYAMREKGGKLIISLEKIFLEPGMWLVEKEVLLPGEYSLLTVKDTGVGMKPEVLERVFEPFFTTKPKGEGTGMGLAVVYGIVKSYNGFIQIESEEQKGTTVFVYLPIYKNGSYKVQ